MTRRMIDSGIWSNEHFAELPYPARLLLIGIINMADDQGRMKANPAYLRSQIFPYDDVSIEMVSEWLHMIEHMDTLMVYQVDDKDYLQLLKWWEYQNLTFAVSSSYPAPDDWQDRVRYTGKGPKIFTCNWINSNGELMPDTCDTTGKPLPKGGKALEPHGQPHGTPPSQPHGQPHAILNEDKDKEYIPTNVGASDDAPPASEPAKEKPKPKPKVHPIVEAYELVLQEYEPGAVLSYGRETKAAKMLAKAGHDPTTVTDCYCYLKTDPFWQEKHLSLQTIATQIGAYLSYCERSVNTNGQLPASHPRPAQAAKRGARQNSQGPSARKEYTAEEAAAIQAALYGGGGQPSKPEGL